MTTSTNLSFDIEHAAAQLPGPDWLAQRRAGYVDKMRSTEFPTAQDELWRYTDINDFSLDRYRPLSKEEIGEPGEKKSPGGGVVAAEAGEHSALIVLRNGRVVFTEISDECERAGVVVAGLAELDENQRTHALQYLGTIAEESSDAFVTLTEAMTIGGAYVYVPRGVVLGAPVVILHWCEGESVACFDRALIVADTSSAVNVIERFESSNDDLFISSITECVVKDNAHVKFLTSQENGRSTTHIGVHRTHVMKDGRFESSTVSLGGKYARVRGEVVLREPGASSDVMAVYFGDENQLLDFRTLQDHRADHTTSSLLFKGAVQDTARSVYSGMIHLREEAQQSQAYQTNRNLVLDQGAHAESIPNLMIEANDVKCSHGSTVGPIDDEQMYYLETRGVSPQDAERLIVLGFFEDVFTRLSVPALIDPLRRSVYEKFSSHGHHHD